LSALNFVLAGCFTRFSEYYKKSALLRRIVGCVGVTAPSAPSASHFPPADHFLVEKAVPSFAGVAVAIVAGAVAAAGQTGSAVRHPGG
jgi:hypothetical protein